MLVTDPFGRPDVQLEVDLKRLSSLEGDHLSNTLVSKLVGIFFCIPSIFGQAAERESVCNQLGLTFSGQYEEGWRSGFCRSNDGLFGFLTSVCRCRVSKCLEKEAWSADADGQVLGNHEDSSRRPNHVVRLAHPFRRRREYEELVRGRRPVLADDSHLDSLDSML
jgi:hypothetical protein